MGRSAVEIAGAQWHHGVHPRMPSFAPSYRTRSLGAVREVLARTGLDRRLFKANLRRRFGRQPVVVYSMPKVGSTAMLHATRASGRPAIPVHNLSPAEREREARQTERTALQVRSTKLWRAGYGGVWRSEWVAQRLGARAAEPWTIITGVREPVARSISAFFHAGERSEAFDPLLEADDIDLGAVVERWESTYWSAARRDWFIDELRAVTDVDVYAEPFPHADGHTTYETTNTRVLLVRNEDIDRVGPAALAAFLDTPVAPPPGSNRARDKNYAGLYERFMADVKISGEILDHAYESRVAIHFYTPEERAGFRRRWVRS
jgi:hypothetical protein